MRARVWGLPAVLAVVMLAGAGPAAPRPAAAGMPGAVDGPPLVLPKIDCADLVGRDLSETPGAPAVIGSATVTPSPGGWEACEVKGIAAPQIQFDVLLPTKTWRQRYLQTGCGAFCG